MIARCKVCGGPCAKDHEVCWFCEHDHKLTKPKADKDKCLKDACPIPAPAKG